MHDSENKIVAEFDNKVSSNKSLQSNKYSVSDLKNVLIQTENCELTIIKYN